MLTVSKRQVHHILMELNLQNDINDGLITQAQIKQVRDLAESGAIREIVTNSPERSPTISENHLDADDVVNIVNNTLQAIKQGYSIVTWHDTDTNVLICGIRPDQIILTDDALCARRVSLASGEDLLDYEREKQERRDRERQF